MTAHDHPEHAFNRMPLKQGGKIRARFTALAAQNRQKAAGLLNAPRLRFGVLFVLYPQINSLNLYDSLAGRPKLALRFCEDVLGEKTGAVVQEPEAYAPALKWMIQTGWRDDGHSDEYDRVLDAAALLLLRSLHDSEELPELVHMLFRRGREGRFVHDLVWAIFGANDPKVLRLLAPYLNSQHRSDRALAAQLLRGGEKTRFENYNGWLKENEPYLRFTDESFLQGSAPDFYKVDLDAKYLCREGQKGKTEPANEQEAQKLKGFAAAKTGERELLARYSARLYKKSPVRWRKWMAAPVERQLVQAKKNGMGGTAR